MKLNALEFWIMNNPVRKVIQSNYEFPNLVRNSRVPRNFNNVLEVGCGDGYGAELINRYFTVEKYYGIDLDHKMIKSANIRGISNAVFSVESATKLPFESDHFDCIFDFAILHHIPNWHDAIDEIARVLKPGGHLLLEDFTSNSFQSLAGNVIRKLLTHPYGHQFTADELESYILKKNLQKQYIAVKYPLGIEIIFAVFQKT